MSTPYDDSTDGERRAFIRTGLGLAGGLALAMYLPGQGAQAAARPAPTAPFGPIPAANPGSPFASMKGHHVGIRVPDFEASKKWFIEKLDFRVVHTWPYADQKLAYVAPANDDKFFIEILGDGKPHPVPKAVYTDLGDSLRLAGYHHACFDVTDVKATVTELRRRGVTIVTEPFELAVVGRRLAFFADPWGNLFELAEVIQSVKGTS